MQKTGRPNPALEKSFEFALEVVALSRRLQDRKEFALASQILRSGTSVGANIEEAMAAQSRKDFLSKMSIAAKEARESRYWLRLLTASGVLQSDDRKLTEKSEELVRILNSIVKTTRDGPRSPNS